MNAYGNMDGSRGLYAKWNKSEKDINVISRICGILKNEKQHADSKIQRTNGCLLGVMMGRKCAGDYHKK